MSAPRDDVRQDRELDRQGRRFGRSGGRLLLVGILLAIPGIVLVALDHGWSIGLGAAIILIGCVPGLWGLGLLISAGVSRWAARRKLFA
jgi:hypothetical protein